jgi:hypothetical protein
VLVEHLCVLYDQLNSLLLFGVTNLFFDACQLVVLELDLVVDIHHIVNALHFEFKIFKLEDFVPAVNVEHSLDQARDANEKPTNLVFLLHDVEKGLSFRAAFLPQTNLLDELEV